MSKDLCFVFLGEFGYELLDWQGKIRKLGQKSTLAIGVASRSNCELLYRDSAKFFISLEDIPEYFESKAHSYFAHAADYNPASGKFGKLLDSYKAWTRRRRIASFITRNLPGKSSVKFIFSDQLNVVEGVSFGAQRNRFEAFPGKFQHPTIYTNYILTDNIFLNLLQLIDTRESTRFQNLATGSRPLILVQRAERELVIRNDARMNEFQILEELSKFGKVVLMEYTPSRTFDTSGVFNSEFKYERITFNSLAEQVALLLHADICVSFSHGDFRSHNYIAPFLGKVGYSIAPFEILKNSAFELWNEKVFPGKIVAIPSDNLLASEIANLINAISLRQHQT